MDWKLNKKLGKIENGNKSQPVMIEDVTVNGKRSLNIRKYYTTDAGELAPTQKGVLISEENVKDLIAALKKFSAE